MFPFQAPSAIPPRTSSTGMTNGTTPKHRRKKSSADGPKSNDGAWSQEHERIVLGPYNYMLQHPGKDIRRQLINAFNAWLKVRPESLEIITKVIAMLHTASLMYVQSHGPPEMIGQR